MSFHTKKPIGAPESQKGFSSSSGLLEPDPPFWTKTSWIQLGYGIWVNLTLMNIGLCLEFAAVTIPQLKEEDSSITMTKNEEATIASILTLSSPIGCILSGLILDKCGRKAGLIWCQVPIAIGWFYTAYAKYASGIIFGRVISGVGIGMAMAAPRAYSTEITLPNMRGVIGALPNLAISFGLTIQAILGAFLGWRMLCFLCGAYAIMLLCANTFLPDTPYYILLNSTASAAKVVLKRFRSSRFNLEAELQTLEEFKAANHIHSLTICETRKALTKSSACKPLGIILFYITLQQCVGVNVITTWAVEILKVARSSIDPHLGNVILAATRIVVGLATSFLLFRVGRRPLALTSAIGVGGVGIFLGGYLLTHEGGRSPLVLLVIFMMFAVPGYHTLPMLMMFEMFPLQIRGILSGVVLSSANLLMFVSVHMYPTLRDSIGLANTFIMYGTISLFGAFILYHILPETKELTLQEIEEYFNHRRLTLVSERKFVSAQARSQMFSSLDAKTKNRHEHTHKKKKRLRIVSSEEVPSSGRNRERSSNADLDKKLSSDEIVTVYDEDARDSGSSDKKYKVDQNNKDNEDDQIKRDKEGQQKLDKVEKGNVDDKAKHDKENTYKDKEKENVDNEVKVKKNITKEGDTTTDSVDSENKDKKESKQDTTIPDETDKPGTSGT